MIRDRRKIIEKRIIEDACELFSLPAATIKLQDIINDESYSADDIVDILEKDTALTTTTLKIANSAAYGRRNKIEDVKKAVLLVGTKELNKIILIAIATNKINSVPPKELNMKEFWMDSLFCERVKPIIMHKSLLI